MAAKKPAAKVAATKETKTKKAATAAAGKEKSLNELIGTLAEKAGITKVQAKAILEAHAELLVEELKQNGSVQLAGVGKLKLGTRPERQGRNPSTGEAITIKATKTVKFAGGKKFKDSFNG